MFSLATRIYNEWTPRDCDDVARSMRAVTGRASRDERPILQTRMTLERMLAECLWLGFEGRSIGPSVIQLEWPFAAEERAQLGLAPLRFKVKFWGECGRTAHAGVFVRETFTPYAVLIKSWGDWDLYIEQIMCMLL